MELRSKIDFPGLKDYLLRNKLGNQRQLDDINNPPCPHSVQVDKLLSHVDRVGGKHGYFLLYVCLFESAEPCQQGHIEVTQMLQEKGN